MLLSEQRPGFMGKITSLKTLPDSARSKLMALGLLPETEIQLIRVAPFGDPIQVRVKETNMALRLSLAQAIEVTGI